MLFCIFFTTSHSYAAKGCDRKINGIQLQDAPLQAKEIILRIMTLANDKNDYIICISPNAENAFAMLNGVLGKRYIAYDPIYVKSLSNQSGDIYWTQVAVFGHEIGHHLLGHLNRFSNAKLTMQQQHQEELDADQFAGKMLAYRGASRVNSQSLMRGLRRYDHGGISTHPNSDRRAQAAATGWQIGCKVMGSECNSPRAKRLTKNLPQAVSNQLPTDHKATQGYHNFFQWANRLKGTLVTQAYCNQYVSLAIAQVNSSIRHRCGYEATTSKQWSREAAPQITWCMGASAYATEREATFREKQLAKCITY